jgi:hypothetical protein
VGVLHRGIDMYISRKYWENYIDSIIDSIQEDKDTIIDMLLYGRLEKAKIIMKLSVDSAPSYQVTIDKMAEKSPFGGESDE